MTNEEIVEGNKLIAQFLNARKTGALILTENFDSTEYSIVMPKERLSFFDKPNFLHSAYDLKMHSSWNRLIPVWAIFRKSNKINFNIDPYAAVIENFNAELAEGDIMACFKTLSDCIKYYNKTKISGTYECTLLELAQNFDELMFDNGIMPHKPKAKYWTIKGKSRQFWEILDVKENGTYPCVSDSIYDIDQDTIITIYYK